MSKCWGLLCNNSTHEWRGLPMLVMDTFYLPLCNIGVWDYHKNLLTRHLPGEHDHEHISEDFTTDNGSNIVKSVEEDLDNLRIPCAGHTLNLSIQAALKVSQLSTELVRCSQIVGHFNKCHIHRDKLAAKQALLELSQHNPMQVKGTPLMTWFYGYLSNSQPLLLLFTEGVTYSSLNALHQSGESLRMLLNFSSLSRSPLIFMWGEISNNLSSRASSCRDADQGWTHGRWHTNCL